MSRGPTAPRDQSRSLEVAVLRREPRPSARDRSSQSERPNYASAQRIAPRPLLVSIEDCAHLLGLSRSVVYTLIRSGALRPVHVGRSVRLRVLDLESFVERLATDAS